jgi:hypothetical protein
MSIGINILSVRSGVAFAPYLTEAFQEFINDHAVTAKVPRQGGKGLVLRSDGDLILRHEHRQESLGPDEVRHYRVTIEMRSQVYNVLRMQDEVVLANLGPELLLSHPQSEMWLSQDTVSTLVKSFESDPMAIDAGSPEWLKLSMGGGRMLLSDQRSGRWVLLGVDHLNELRGRLAQLRTESTAPVFQSPPLINLKGIRIHLQSALKLLSTMEDFAAGRGVSTFEESTPTYLLKVTRSTNGLELSDDDNHTVLNSRETAKWTDLIKAEIEALHVSQIERGRIRTVFARDDGGLWLLQWGDEVFVPGSDGAHSVRRLVDTPGASSGIVARRLDDFFVVMNYSTGNCVALTEFEVPTG